MKKTIILILLSLCLLNPTAFAELTQTDLSKINDLILASEKRMKEYVDLKIDALDKKLTGEINTVKEEIRTLDAKLTGQIDALDKKLTGEIKTVDGRVSLAIVFVVALIGLIAVAVGIPQFLLARRGKEMEAYLEKVEALSREIEALKQQRIVGS